eukprot:g33682.t1
MALTKHSDEAVQEMGMVVKAVPGGNILIATKQAIAAGGHNGVGNQDWRRDRPFPVLTSSSLSQFVADCCDGVAGKGLFWKDRRGD